MADETATTESRLRLILERDHCVGEIGVSEPLEDAGLDSLDRAELWMGIEAEFRLPETDPDVEDECLTVGQICAYIERKKQQ